MVILNVIYKQKNICSSSTEAIYFNLNKRQNCAVCPFHTKQDTLFVSGAKKVQ